MIDINEFETFKTVEPIKKGWSSDKKYYVETATNEKLLLRITDISQYEQKKMEYKMMKLLSENGVPVSRPVDFGICDDGNSVYGLFSWFEGEDAEAVLPSMTETEQYVLGVKAGQHLRKIHRIPAPIDLEEWDLRFNRKVDRNIKNYRNCGIRIDDDDLIISYLEENRRYLTGRPQSFQHGDYHVGNMIISPEGKLAIIDFNRWDYGDPWEEFNRIVWSAGVSPHFATGQIHGYFDGNPPDLFFKLLAFYMSSNTLSSIPWAISYGEDEVEVMKNQAKEFLSWFDGMNNMVPAWYKANFYIQFVDDIPYRLKSPFDF